MVYRSYPSFLAEVSPNIISNAIKFTEANGEIKILVADKPETVEIKISDNGVGISEAMIKQIKEGEVKQSMPGTNKEKGYGFGLLLCRQFIQQNEGELKIVSEQGKGSTFMISLPK